MNENTTNTATDRHFHELKPGDVCIWQPGEAGQSIVRVDHVQGNGWTGRLMYCTELLEPPFMQPEGGSTNDLTRICAGDVPFGTWAPKPFGFRWIAVRDCQYGTVHVSLVIGLQPGEDDDLLEVVPVFDGRDAVANGKPDSTMRRKVHMIATDDHERLWSAERVDELDRMQKACEKRASQQAEHEPMTLPADLLDETWVEEVDADLTTPIGRHAEAVDILHTHRQVLHRLRRLGTPDAIAALKAHQHEDFGNCVENLSATMLDELHEADLAVMYPMPVTADEDDDTTAESEAA